MLKQQEEEAAAKDGGSHKKKGGKSAKHAKNASMDKEVETFKNIVKDYNRVHVDPRDFNSDLPILQALGAESYDKLQNIDYLQIQLEVALKKFVKDWKTVDSSKINQLMQYGIVQEVMKIEERKAVRREAALRPSPVKKNEDDEDTSVNNGGGPGKHSPRPT